MLRDKDGVVRIDEVTVPEGSGLMGRTIESLHLRQHGNLLLLAVVRADSPHPLYNPDDSYIIQAGDSLVFQAYLDSLARFRAAYI
jgi:Trk K+ transport system NAD-binding subunit